MDSLSNKKVPASALKSSKSKKLAHSITKSQRSLRSSDEQEKSETQSKILKMMTEDPYARVFNKLMNIQNLKEFVVQASQYVEFREEEVKKFIPPTHSQKLRLSWSMKQPNSILSYLDKDFRFLKHYHELLETEFPHKANQFRSEMHNFYKHTVIKKQKFDQYFASDHLQKSIKPKSNRKIFGVHNSRNKSNAITKSLKKQNSSHSPEPRQVSKKALKTLQTHQEKQNIQKPRIQKPKQTKNKSNLDETHSQQLNKDKSYQNYRISQKEHNLNGHNFQTLKSAMKQIQQSFPAPHSISNDVKSEFKQNFHPNSQNQTNSKKSYTQIKQQQIILETNRKPNLVLKKDMTRSKKNQIKEPEIKQKSMQKIEEKAFETSFQNDGNDEISNEQYERIRFSQRKLKQSKSKKKSKSKSKNETEAQRKLRLSGWQSPNAKSVKKPLRIAPISAIFDESSVEFKQFTQSMKKIDQERMNKIEEKRQEDFLKKEWNESVARKCHQFNKQMRYTFGEKQRQTLTCEQKQIVACFPQITTIGNPIHFQFDRQFFQKVKLGECYGYALEQLLCSPVKNFDDKSFICLYLKKKDNYHDNDLSSRKDHSEDIKELKKRIQKQELTKQITLLFIQKPNKSSISDPQSIKIKKAMIN